MGIRISSDDIPRTDVQDRGYDNSTGANEMKEVSPALLQTMEVTMLDAITADDASSSINVLNYNKLTFHIIASSITIGGTMTLSHSLDGTNYYDFAEKDITANGVTEVVVENRKYKYVKATLSSRTDGTYTVLAIMGN